MPETDIASSIASDLTNAMTDFSVDQASTDGVSEQKETFYTNADWAKWYGYYTTIPELQAVIDAKATWTVGKGFTAEPTTTMLLDTIKGWGKDTFNTILENMIRVYQIGGDAFAQVIRDDDGNLINIKPLDPAVIEIVVNRQGLIKEYRQKSKTEKQDKVFQPYQMLHLARNRVADQIHGTGIIEILEETILRINEAKSDWKRVLHRNVDPMMIWHLDTDDTTKIAAFKKKVDDARGNGENMYIPKNNVVPELVTTATNATLSPLAWIDSETDRFYEASGVPKIILGGVGGITEAAVKIAYLAFQQTVEEEQLFIEEQILSQLNLVIELTFPADLTGEALSDKPKAEQRPIESEQAAEPNDTTVETEGRK